MNFWTDLGTFIQYQVLGMQWLNGLIGQALMALGMDLSSPIAGSLQFFIYDTIKISVLLCFLIFSISYVQSFFSPERSKAILGRFNGLSANTMAALLGTITPFCSCSSIPLFIGFTSAGLPLGVTFSFLISSPMVDLASLVLISSIFGAKVAFAYVILGLVIAILGGTLISKLNMDNYIEDIVRPQRIKTRIITKTLSTKERLSFAYEQMKNTFNKVFIYILIGVGIGAFIHNWIPQTYIVSLLGSHSTCGVLIATLVGIPMYADIFGTIPVAEALLAKGALLGTVLAFMMSVTTLSLPSLIMLRKAIKPRLLFTFLAICILGIVLVGLLFNFLQPHII